MDTTLLFSVLGPLIIAVAFFYGLFKGKSIEQQKQAQEAKEAVEQREKVDEEIKNLPEPDVDKRLDKWMRDD